MKNTILITAFCALFIISSQAQKESSDHEKMPPVSELVKLKSGEKASFYELPSDSDFEIYDSNGQKITEGKGQWVNTIDFEDGKYYVVQDKKKTSFIIGEASVEKQTDQIESEQLSKSEQADLYKLPQQGKFQVYDKYGNLVAKGEGEYLNTSSLKKGDYFIVMKGQKFQMTKE